VGRYRATLAQSRGRSKAASPPDPPRASTTSADMQAPFVKAYLPRPAISGGAADPAGPHANPRPGCATCQARPLRCTATRPVPRPAHMRARKAAGTGPWTHCIARTQPPVSGDTLPQIRTICGQLSACTTDRAAAPSRRYGAKDVGGPSDRCSPSVNVQPSRSSSTECVVDLTFIEGYCR
jgi:hypothetical protein